MRGDHLRRLTAGLAVSPAGSAANGSTRSGSSIRIASIRLNPVALEEINGWYRSIEQPVHGIERCRLAGQFTLDESDDRHLVIDHMLKKS